MTGRTNLEQGQSYRPQSEFVLPLNSNGKSGFGLTEASQLMNHLANINELVILVLVGKSYRLLIKTTENLFYRNIMLTFVI